MGRQYDCREAGRRLAARGIEEIDGEAVATVDGVELLLRCDPSAVVDAPR